MATVTITSFPYTYVSEGTDNDTLVLPPQYKDKVLTLFAKVTTAGSAQIAVGSACGDDNPAWESTDTILPTIVGGDYGEINIKASGASVEVNLSLA